MSVTHKNAKHQEKASLKHKEALQEIAIIKQVTTLNVTKV